MMGFKLCSFLVFCHIVFATGTVTPKTNNTLHRLEDHIFDRFPPSRKNVVLENNNDQPNIIILTEKPILIVETSTLEKTDGEPKTEEPTSTMETTTIDDPHDVVTEPNSTRHCPEEQSYISEKDLNDMISYLAIANNLTQIINGSYFELATSVRDRHIKTMHDFRTRFQNRPTHLTHILDDIIQIRIEQTEPLVKQITSMMPDISSLQIKYSEHIHNSNMQLEKFEKSKKICTLNCDSTEFRPRRRRSISESSSLTQPPSISPSADIYYCTYLKEVKHKINVVLSNFKNDYINTLQNSLHEVDRNFDENIENLKLDMKKAAVQEFGTTMYDVLSLGDEYYHILNFLKGENGINEFEYQVSMIRKNNMRIDYKTEELKNSVEKYRKHCLSCDKRQQRYRRNVLQGHQQPLLEPTNDVSLTEPNDVSPIEPNRDVLEQLLNNYIVGIKTKFEIEQDNLFEQLSDIITDKEEIIRNALVNLQPLQNKIINDLKIEEQKFNGLKNQVPELLLHDLKKNYEDSINLQNKLDDALKFIQKTIEI